MTRWIGISLMLAGLIVGAYFSLEWHTGRSAAENLDNKELKKYQKIEKAVHEDIKVSDLNEQEAPYVKQTSSTSMHYPKGEQVAMLVIPKIGQKYSVYWGTDADVLKRGVGMFVSNLTTTPKGGGHTVLSGHRDTVFYNLHELKEGDVLNVEYDGSLFTYTIQNIFITEKNDRSVIVKKGEPTLTLTTCYPFNYVGNAPERYVIQAILIQ
ncbi:class D sortase [Bacillus sp. V5-8f]|uniref:class D sortase n=1 Tax=Bacillus sp. V5-8f TaxID=2053044 RepID=UPI000C77E3C0|nr:class D sortase [Bacillus sp. V5-8f]PLT33091.1 class D sortase [Bacillus sp. V5-8f]